METYGQFSYKERAYVEEGRADMEEGRADMEEGRADMEEELMLRKETSKYLTRILTWKRIWI